MDSKKSDQVHITEGIFFDNFYTINKSKILLRLKFKPVFKLVMYLGLYQGDNSVLVSSISIVIHLPSFSENVGTHA